MISGKAESGKDSFYQLSKEVLKEKGIEATRFAYGDNLKKIAYMLGWSGDKTKEREREYLIWLGDGTRGFYPNAWVNLLFKDILSFLLNSKQAEQRNNYKINEVIFITDCRYPNEIMEMQRLIREEFPLENIKFTTVRMVRSNHENKLTPEQRQNPSETALDNFRFDFYVHNDHDLHYLKHWARDILHKIQSE
jgi:hypothetical protein